MPTIGEMDVAAAQRPAELPLRPQDEVECRRCEVHCDKVVYPAACVERAARSSTRTRSGGTPTSAACRRCTRSRSTSTCCARREARRGGFGAVAGEAAAAADVPLEVDETYDHRADELGCVNPEFREMPSARPTFRVFAQLAD